MQQRRSRARGLPCSALVLLLTGLCATAGLAQSGGTCNNTTEFIRGLVGEWVGTCVQTTDGKPVDDKYFHAVIKQAGETSFETAFEYYRLDPETGAPTKAGAATMVTSIGADGAATNRITGSGQVMIDPKTSKPERHDVSEVLRLAGSGDLAGTGGGSIHVSGLPFGAGKNGKVRDYRSTWSVRDGVLKIAQQLRAKFSVLVFSKSFDIAATYTARRGSDVMDLMKRAARARPVTGASAR